MRSEKMTSLVKLTYFTNFCVFLNIYANIHLRHLSIYLLDELLTYFFSNVPNDLLTYFSNVPNVPSDLLTYFLRFTTILTYFLRFTTILTYFL
jgi:hypothetical protein